MKNIRFIIMVVAVALGVAAAPVSVHGREKTPVAPTDTVMAGAYTAREVFVKLPLNVLEIISHSTRLDMLDYFDSDSIWKAPNAMEGRSWLKEVKPEFLSVQITPVSTLEIRMLPARKGPLALCVYTIKADDQAADSQITIFDSTMTEVRTDRYYKVPEIRDFFSFPDRKKEDEVLDLIPFPTIELNASPDNDDLTATLTVGKYMTKEDYDKVAGYLKAPLSLKWDGKKYKIQKDK